MQLKGFQELWERVIPLSNLLKADLNILNGNVNMFISPSEIFQEFFFLKDEFAFT